MTINKKIIYIALGLVGILLAYFLGRIVFGYVIPFAIGYLFGRFMPKISVNKRKSERNNNG